MNDQNSDWAPAKHRKTSSVLSTASTDEIDIGELFRLFWQRKLLLISVMLIAMVFGAWYASGLPNLYEAETQLILEEQEQNASGLESLTPGLSTGDTEIQSQIQILKSRQLIGKVVDELNLIEDPEYVASLRKPSLFSVAIKWLRSKISSNKGEVRKGNVRDRVIDQLIGKIDARIVPNTYAFNVRIESQSVEKSVAIVNMLADAFVEDQIIEKTEATEKGASWLRGKVSELQKVLNAAEEKAATFRSLTERSITEENLAQSNQNLKRARGRYESFILALLRTTGSKVPVTDVDVSRSNVLLNEINELEAIVEKQTADLLTIRQLDREAETQSQIYKHFATRLNEIEVQKGLHESDIRILSYAVPRPTPVQPNKRRLVLTFGLLGLILCAGYL